MSLLNLKNVKSEVEGKEILKGVDLTINKGEVHVIMGPNGAGKSTLASILVGHPKHEVVGGQILLEGEDITELEVDERAQKGIFLSFQYPEEIPGLTVEDFLRTAKEAVTGEKQYIMQFHNELVEKMEKLHINPEYAERHLNVGFSGGEKKKNEYVEKLKNKQFDEVIRDLMENYYDKVYKTKSHTFERTFHNADEKKCAEDIIKYVFGRFCKYILSFFLLYSSCSYCIKP